MEYCMDWIEGLLGGPVEMVERRVVWMVVHWIEAAQFCSAADAAKIENAAGFGCKIVG